MDTNCSAILQYWMHDNAIIASDLHLLCGHKWRENPTNINFGGKIRLKVLLAGNPAKINIWREILLEILLAGKSLIRPPGGFLVEGDGAELRVVLQHQPGQGLL